MTETTSERLYHLLPSIYRQRDVSQGEPLRALLAVIESEFRLLEADLEGLYENWFIETCDEWVVPYLGDLLGIRGLNDEKNIVLSQRARVANTLNAARRKGTVATLERLARDTTGWHVTAVEFFERLTATQHLQHVRLGQGGTFDVRQNAVEPALPFDQAAHTPEVRRMEAGQGRYNIPNVGLFLCRLQSYPVTRSPARALADPADRRYTFSPVGRDLPLFNRPQVENDFSHAAEEVNLPVPIRPEAFERDLALYQNRYSTLAREHQPLNSNYYGPARSLNIIKDDQPVRPGEVMSADLSQWDTEAQRESLAEALSELGKVVAVDVHLGRLMFASGHQPNRAVEVNFNYGFSADLGGGSYDRRQTLADASLATWQITVAKASELDTLQKALTQWETDGKPRGLIQIVDNGIYGGEISLDLPPEGWLAIEAADGVCPSVRLVEDLRLTSADPESRLILNGLLIEGGIQVRNSLQLNISHCTLTPGRTLRENGRLAFPDRDVLVVSVDPNFSEPPDFSELEVTLTHSLVGPLRLPANCKHLAIQDSIVDAPDVNGERRPAIAADDEGRHGPPTSLERTTVFGSVHVQELTLASEVIFTAPVQVAQCETKCAGCVRYSYVPPGSRTPPRFRCQPDLALAQITEEADKKLAQARLRPRFTSTRYGDPAYAQLALNCAPEIRTGAENGSELGVFQHLYQPQREMNLRLVLDEYLRFGLEAGISYIT